MESFELEMKCIFLEEARLLLDETEPAVMRLDQGDFSQAQLEEILRLLHNLKGAAKSVGFDALSEFVHRLEDFFALLPSGKCQFSREFCSLVLKGIDFLKASIEGLSKDLNFPLNSTALENDFQNFQIQGEIDEERLAEVLAEITDQSIQELVGSEKAVTAALEAPAIPSKVLEREFDSILVARQKLDLLLNLVGELVVNQSILSRHRLRGTTGSEAATKTLSYMEKLVPEIQSLSVLLRMVPLKPLFQKMHRVVRDCSIYLNKDVQLVMEGEHTELDKPVFDSIRDPLTHLIRNAVDHGIESTEEREKLGKPRSGRITLSARLEDDRILLRVSDDGRGLSYEKILNKARSKGLIAEDDELSHQDAYSLIFRSGFSTTEEVTDISGRGVGMDVVKQVVEGMKGSISIETEEGKGTDFLISLPLTLSIIQGLLVDLDKKTYVVPVSQLLEIVEYDKGALPQDEKIGRTMEFRGDHIPVLHLSSLLHQTEPTLSSICSKGTGLITLCEGRRVSFQVDQVVGQQQVVVKKLGSELDGLPGVLGGAILSEGDVSLILDLNEIYRSCDAFEAA